MAQTILIEDNEILNDLISVNINAYLGVDLIERKTGMDAINLLMILPSIDLIITAARIGVEETANTIIRFIEENNLITSVIVLGSEKYYHQDFVLSISNRKDWESVVHYSAKILGINEGNLAKKIIPDFVPVPVKYFLNLDQTNCDIYIRIKKSVSEFQFVKRIHAEDSFSRDVIKKYLQQGLINFYVPKEDHKIFSTFVSNRLIEKMDNPKSGLAEKIEIMGDTYDLAIKEISSLGFTTDLIQLTDSLVQNMIKNFETSPIMSGLLHKLINSKTGIMFQKAHMTSVVASDIIKNLNLNEMLRYEKMAYAAFFHDIMLADYEDLAKINSQEELLNARLPIDKFNLVSHHAKMAAELIFKYPDVPIGTDEIIRHHHGSLIGEGFETEIDKLPDLSKIFIIAHHFVVKLLLFKETGGEPRPITDDLYRIYPSADMIIIIKALEKTLKRKK
jgi:hypothetical protein